MSILIDTGVLLRVFVKADLRCGPIRDALRHLSRQHEVLKTTFQNLAEFYNVSTRPVMARGGYGLPVTMVKARVRFIERLCDVVTENDTVYQRWKQLTDKYQVTGVAVHDARLVAIMLTYNINRVMTVNDRDFQRYLPEGISVVTPEAVVQNRP